jgi:Transposase DDE domain group 1
MTSCIPQLLFSFYRHRPIRADFCGGQISSDAGLLPLRAFDQRYGLTGGLAERVCDPRDKERIGHSGCFELHSSFDRRAVFFVCIPVH